MPSWFHETFYLGAPLLEKMIRPVIVYLALVILLRIFGKRELAQLNPFDLVVLLSLSNTVQNAIIGNDNSVTGGLVGALTLLGINYLVVRFLFRHRRLDELLEGKPAILIEDGRVMHKALASEMLTRAELLTVLHRQGYENVDDVQRCVLEPGGTFFIQRKGVPDEQKQHAEIIDRLDELKAQVQALKNARPTEPRP
jgi:uncharacterized membrane protein YcaP (DUF421 family)